MALETPPVVLVQAASQASQKEIDLAASLAIPLIGPEIQGIADNVKFAMQYAAAGLCLTMLEDKAPGPLVADFTAPKLVRRAQDSIKKQDLGKAIGLQRHPAQQVLDATAGLGSDAFLMASAGCTVTLLEKSTIVAALLADALQRGQHSSTSIASSVSRMRLRCLDFMAFDGGNDSYDVVYLDPMFPDDSRTARSAKSMYFLQQLLEKTEDEEQLLARGLAIARRRVVVKRNRKSPIIGDAQPDIQFKGSSNRYDVYLIDST